MTTDKLRSLFLDYFRNKGHEVVPSASLVPADDPTLLFTGAGMNQFKERFLGRGVTYERAASCQKCLRTGDLENVGKTSGHHTFFEMLGNFSFGDYFKKEAVSFAWEFLTGILKLDPKRLWVSVYKDDDEAYAVWRDDVKVPKERIVKLGAKDNFWPSEAPEKGPNGPCGPCSEIFFDWGAGTGCGKPACDPGHDCGRFVEVWNLVFTQFDRQSDGDLKPLPSKNIDTGMGLERLAAVMQGVQTNFEIDIFKPIVQAISNKLQTPARRSPKGAGGTNYKLRNAKINAIADHIRAVTFAIADGVMPSNEERGYVVRKLIRRSLSHAIDIKIEGPFLYKLVDAVADVMKAPYPEVKDRRDDIAQVVMKEEENFLTVIETQVPKAEEAFEKFARPETRDPRPGLAEIAFNFYDTYGMPYDMLEEIAKKKGLGIDRSAFDALLDRQRQMSRSKTKIRGEIFSETFAKKVEALGLKTDFLGYEKAKADATVVAVLDGGEVVLDRTPFYGESGGQAGDWGKIETPSGAMEVEDAKKFGDTIVHIGRMLRGEILKGEAAHVSVDEETRRRVMANHTATHLLHAALRKVLGEHVRQTGSLVDEGHLRFDFTHMKKMEPSQIARVEEVVNENIRKEVPVKKEIKDIEAAKSEGAIALFGEKYGHTVRVVSVGEVSKELCGGTHLDNTKDIGVFKIASESSIASGVRRIEAVTGKAALDWIEEQKVRQITRTKAESDKEAKKIETKARLREEASRIGEIVAGAHTICDITCVSRVIPNADIEILRVLSDNIKARLKRRGVIILATRNEAKTSFIVSVTDDLIREGIMDANVLAKELARELGGSGGGRPGFAQGGGKDPSRMADAMEKIIEVIGAMRKEKP